MAGAWARIALRLLLCACVVLPLWWLLGAIGLVVAAPLFGLALAKPVMELVSEHYHFTRELAYRDVQGRHYEFKGSPIDVIEDEDDRWLRLADLRRILDKLPADAVFAQIYPAGYRERGQPAVAYLSCEALLAYLHKATAPRSLKFRHWVERTVTIPGRRARARRDGARYNGAMADPTAADVREYIAVGLVCTHLEVEGDGQHFFATIVSDEFTGKTRIARHQRVYAALGDRMRSQIHALSMKTLTPAEWAQQNASTEAAEHHHH